MAHKNNLLLGFSPSLAYAADRRFQNINGRQGAMTSNGKEFWSNFEFYGQNEHYVFKRLVLVTGMQLTLAQRNYVDKFHGNPNGNQTKHNHYFGACPKVGLIFNTSPTSQIYTNFSRAFEPPTSIELIQLGGINGDILTTRLKAQRASSFEIGTRGASRRFSWDSTYYLEHVTNELLTLNNAIGAPLGTVNGSPTRHQGIESGFSLVVADGIFCKQYKHEFPDASPTLALGPGLVPLKPEDQDRLVFRPVYNWNDFHFINDAVYGRNRLPGIPPHLLQATLYYEHPSGFYAGPTINWSMTRTPVDYANTAYNNPYFITGLRGGFRSQRGWNLFVEMRNIANCRYASVVEVVANAKQAGNPQIFIPGEGRAIYAGFEFRR